MKVFVTGGGGFLGQYICRVLIAEGYQVVAFQRGAHPELEAMGVQVRRGSITATDALAAAMQGCEAVIHTAAKAGVWGPRSEFFTTNLDGTRNVLAVMERQGIKRLVHCSSPSIVFNGSSIDGADESIPYGRNWHCAYPESKALAEQAALEWGRSGRGRIIALRPHLIWGRGDPHLLPVVIERSRAGRLRIVGGGRNRVDITRVENAAAAHILALRALDKPSAVNRPYFIGQADPVVLWDWINDLLQRLGIGPIRRSVPYSAAYALGGLCEGIWSALKRPDIPPMTRFVAQSMGKSHWFSIEAARRELGYQPEAFPTDEGMDAYVAAVRKEFQGEL